MESAPECTKVQEVFVISGQLPPAKCHLLQTASKQEMSACKKWCKYGVTRTRLEHKGFTDKWRAIACIMNRSGRKWQMWDWDCSLLENLWSLNMTLKIAEFLFPLFPQKFHPIHTQKQRAGNWIMVTLYFRRFPLHDPSTWCTLSIIILSYHSLLWSLWPWSLTVSYHNCKCSHYLFPSAVLVNTRTMCGL